MFNPHTAKGLRYVGDLTLENGQALPIFEPVPPKDGPDINTLEGWNAFCNRLGNEPSATMSKNAKSQSENDC